MYKSNWLGRRVRTLSVIYSIYDIHTERAVLCTRFSSSLFFSLPLLSRPPFFPFLWYQPVRSRRRPRSSWDLLSWTRVTRWYTGFMGIFMRIYRAWNRRCSPTWLHGTLFRRLWSTAWTADPDRPSLRSLRRIYNAPRIVPCSTRPLFSRFAPPGHGHHRGTRVCVSTSPSSPDFHNFLIDHLPRIGLGMMYRPPLIFFDHGFVRSRF